MRSALLEEVFQLNTDEEVERCRDVFEFARINGDLVRITARTGHLWQPTQRRAPTSDN